MEQGEKKYFSKTFDFKISKNKSNLLVKLFISTFISETLTGSFESYFPLAQLTVCCTDLKESSHWRHVRNAFYRPNAYVIKVSGQLVGQTPYMFSVCTSSKPFSHEYSYGAELLSPYSPLRPCVWSLALGILADRVMLGSSYTLPLLRSAHQYPFHSRIVKQFS